MEDTKKPTLLQKKKKLEETIAAAKKQGNNEVLEKAMKAKKEMFPEALKEDKVTVKNITKRIDTEKVPSKLLSGQGFKSKISMLRKAKKAARAIPGIGMVLGTMSALGSGDVSAAVPVLGDASEIGTDKAIEDPSSQEYKERMKMLKMKKIKNKLAKGN